jgi:hypothetical protein
MGYSANTISSHPQYGSSLCLSHGSFLSYWADLTDRYDEDKYHFLSNDELTFFELDKRVVEEEIERLQDKPDKDFAFDEEVTNKQVAKSLEIALYESPTGYEYVAWQWF